MRWNIPWSITCCRVAASFSGRKDKGKLNHRTPPHMTGPSAKPEKRGVGPAGSGWLVARVPVAWSTITSGPQSDTPHSRPASRSQSVVASLK
jgi:hypothetical protein